MTDSSLHLGSEEARACVCVCVCVCVRVCTRSITPSCLFPPLSLSLSLSFFLSLSCTLSPFLHIFLKSPSDLWWSGPAEPGCSPQQSQSPLTLLFDLADLAHRLLEDGALVWFDVEAVDVAEVGGDQLG